MGHFFLLMKTDCIYQLFKASAGVSTDSRKISEGEIFFALWGEKYNGNEYAAEAIKKGASWAVIDDPAFESGKTILVDDCLLELQALAAQHRKEMNVPVLAITGTNGKTTTKELTVAILSEKFRVHATHGNLNNHIGVPLTILSAPGDTNMMIIEMGANHIGEISSLCMIARPDYGIITNISESHIEGFGSLEGVIKAKTELYEYLRKVNGVALYNEKDLLLSEKIYKLVNRAVPFADPTGIDLKISVLSSALNLSLIADYQHKTYKITTKLFGSCNVENIRAAIATGLFFEVSMDDIVAALEKYEPGNNRSQVKVTEKNTLICDSYNANPVSMKMAIEAFAAVDAEKKVCILGDMLELGDSGDGEHMSILRMLGLNHFDRVILTGPVFSRLAKGSPFDTFSDTLELKEYLGVKPLKGNHILIKGSRGIGLERIYDLL